MKHQGFKNKEIMDALGIKHVAQINLICFAERV